MTSKIPVPNQFSPRYKFADWPNPAVPNCTAGVYLVWEGETFVYAGMSGRGFDPDVAAKRTRYGLVTRLASHAAGRLSGDQFCVYVANRLVIPSLMPDHLQKFACGELTLDQLTRAYIHSRFEYQFAACPSGEEAFRLEKALLRGEILGVRPQLNPR